MRSCRLLVPVVLSLPCSGQTTWFVDAQGTPPGSGSLADPYTSIAFAVARPATVDGDTVQVAQGTYLETVDFLGKAVRVVGVGRPTIDAAGAGSVVSFRTREGRDSVLENFVLTGGSAPLGGGLYIFYSAPTILACEVSGNTATDGGGVWTALGFPRFEECVIESNVASNGVENGRGGGIAVIDGRIGLEACELLSNLAADGGGLFLAGARATLAQTAIEDNDARNDGSFDLGGGAYVDALSRLALSDGCAVRENRSENDGAGIYVDGVLSVRDSVIEANLAGFSGDFKCTNGRGGGIAAGDEAWVEVLDSTFTGNDGCLEGGALALDVANADSVRIERCVLTDNRAQYGGGIYDDGSFGPGAVFVEDSGFLQNKATSLSGTSDFGGGVYGPATLERCRLEGNTATGNGGGANGARLIDCDVIENVVFDTAPQTSFGGGLFGGSAVGSRFFGNRTVASYGPGYGGGACLSSLTDCVLAGNRADIGGAAWASTLASCTVVANEAMLYGGGVADVGITNSIVRGNVPDQVAGTSTATWCDVEGGFGGAGNFDANPLFWDPGAGDLNLSPGSPCIDAGDPAGPPDVDGSRADVGALDFDPTYCPGPTRHCVPKASADGCLPSIDVAGTPSASGPDDFRLLVDNVAANRPGLFIIGHERADAPLLGGRLCVGAFIRRPYVTSTAIGAGPCLGLFDHFVGQAELAALGFVPGDCLSAQLWYRDPTQPDGTGIGLSDGISLALEP